MYSHESIAYTDFVLTYEEGKGDPDLREKFLESMKENGLEYYVQVYKTTFI